MKGINSSDPIRARSTQEHDTNTWLSSNRALSTHSLLPLETWDPLNQVPVTQTVANWMQGRSARTSINSCVLRAHHPSQTRKYKFTRRWSENTDKINRTNQHKQLIDLPNTTCAAESSLVTYCISLHWCCSVYQQPVWLADSFRCWFVKKYY